MTVFLNIIFSKVENTLDCNALSPMGRMRERSVGRVLIAVPFTQRMTDLHLAEHRANPGKHNVTM